jgi:hypothetical protein
MSNAHRHGAVRYAVEDVFGENADTVTTRLLTLEPVDLSGFEHPKEEVNATLQHQADAVQDVPLTQNGTFQLVMYLSGLGSSGEGAISANDLVTLLGLAIGNSSATSQGTTIEGTSSATALDVAGGAFAAGSLCRVGVLGDGRGNGQAAAVAELAAGTLSLLTALGGAPVHTPAADKVFAMALVYPNESHNQTSGPGLRFLLQTANQSILAHGCYATEVAISGLSNGQLPRVTITYAASWWEFVAQAMPTSVAHAAHEPAPVAAGSIFLQALGTSTRATVQPREFELTINLETVALPGPEGHNPYQRIVGYRRTRCQAMVSMQIDAQANTATPLWSERWADTSKEWHLLATFSAVDGRALALYCPRMQIVGNRPTQADREGLNVVPLQLRAVTGPDDESELTLSNFRLGLG